MTAPGRDGKSPPTYQAIGPQVAELAAAGESRNSIARALQVAPSTVSKAATHAGVEFTAASADAIKGRRRQASRDRLDVVELSSDIALRAGGDLLDALDAGDVQTAKTLATVYGIAADKIAALSKITSDDTEADQDHGKSVLSRFITAVETQYHYQGGDLAADTGAPYPHQITTPTMEERTS